MRPALFVSLFLVATAAFAQNVRFNPPNPTSRTPVTAHVVGHFSTCSPAVTRNVNLISVTLQNCSLQPSSPLVDVPVDLGVIPAGVYDVVVGLPQILIGLGEGTLIVQDAAPPFQVTPNGGIAGDQITLTGDNIEVCATGPSPIVCGSPVLFDGILATVISATPNQVTVQAPQHDPGPVDITIGTLHSTAAFDYIETGKTPDPAYYEPVLFPVAFSGAGAFGSQWVTNIEVRNENDYRLWVLPVNTLNPACRIFECSWVPPAHSTADTGGLNTANGIVVFFARQATPKIHFGVLIRDMSRQGQSLGTEIPVVREKDFFDRPLELLNVPTDSRFRVALRVYDLGTPNGIHFTAQPLGADDVLVDDFVFPAGQDPSYAQISDLVAKYPQLAGKGPLRITVDPPVAGNPTLWAFASVTNNDTQQVTTISPQ